MSAAPQLLTPCRGRRMSVAAPSSESSWTFDHAGFVRAILAKRLVLKITTRQLADDLGIPYGFLSQIHTLKHEPSIGMVVRLCEWLGLTVDAFVARPAPAEAPAHESEAESYE